MASKLRRTNKRPLSSTVDLETIQYYSKLFRRVLHTSVCVLNPIALIYFAIKCAIAFQVSELASLDFVQHGYRGAPYFFSLWMSVLQYVYFGMYSAIDLLEVMSEKKRQFNKLIEWMHTVASYLLFTIIFPFSTMVGILFWGVYHWDRTYIYPPLLDEWVSQWPNHVMHTIPIPLSVVYMLVSNKIEPPKLVTFSGAVAFLGFYSYIFFNYRSATGKWLYLSLEQMTPTQVQAVLVFAGVSPIVFHWLGYKINDFFKSAKRKVPLVEMLSC